MTSTFDRLHPALQYHLVNSLGWSSLRSFQLDAIGPILDGHDVLLLAPTAGGKTEAAFFPVLSQVVAENRRGLSVLYVCPIKALLNNLEPRLARYAGFVGRRVGLWHGDVSEREKAAIRRDPPDVLLTTPESIEGLLISTRADRSLMFGNIRQVIVDELHAFGGDDRGWHLRAVVTRLKHYAVQRPQQIGLSATVGNPADLLRWFSSAGEGRILGEAAPPKGGELVLDFVGSIDGAAQVVQRLYEGDKRLVFCDSRSKVESLASLLRERGVRTFVSHSSLSVSERKAAETAFAEDRNCVIVATSTLELGIDVGDLDRVIQIDAPGTVSSLLQRMGRTGRRPGQTRNCTFLATNEESLLAAGALCRLLAEGFTEPVAPPDAPWHLVAQQAMTLSLEHVDLAQADLVDRLQVCFKELPPDEIARTVAHLLATGYLSDLGGPIAIGPRGEKEYGAKNFLELMASFSGPDLLLVQHGMSELGYVDPISVRRSTDGQPTRLSLAGHSWEVTGVDWIRKLVWVRPSQGKAKSRWLGSSRAMHFELAQAVRATLRHGALGCTVSKRAQTRLDALQEAFSFLTDAPIQLVHDADGWHLWTFAGGSANAVLAMCANRSHQPSPVTFDDFSLLGQLPDQFAGLNKQSSKSIFSANFSEVGNLTESMRAIKFCSSLPVHQADACIIGRRFNMAVARRLIEQMGRGDRSE